MRTGKLHLLPAACECTWRPLAAMPWRFCLQVGGSLCRVADPLAPTESLQCKGRGVRWHRADLLELRLSIHCMGPLRRGSRYNVT